MAFLAGIPAAISAWAGGLGAAGTAGAAGAGAVTAAGATAAGVTAGTTSAATAGLGTLAATSTVPGLLATTAPTLTAGVTGATAATATSGVASNLALATGLIGTGVSALAQNKAAEQEADMMELNADIAKQDASAQVEKGKGESLKISRDRRQTLGTQRAMFGAAGVDIVGSPLEVMANTAAEYERDIYTTGFNASNLSHKAMLESQIYNYGAKQARKTGLINAGGTLLTGYGKTLLGRYA